MDEGPPLWAKYGGFDEVVIALSYTVSPIHTDEFYAEKARQIPKSPYVDRLYIKDHGGLLNPARVWTLVHAIVKDCSGKPVEKHTHCNKGRAPLCLPEAKRAIPPEGRGAFPVGDCDEAGVEAEITLSEELASTRLEREVQKTPSPQILTLCSGVVRHHREVIVAFLQNHKELLGAERPCLLTFESD